MTKLDLINCRVEQIKYKFRNLIQSLRLIEVEPLFYVWDIWVGIFYDKKKQWIYILPVPMMGIIIKFDRLLAPPIMMLPDYNEFDPRLEILENLNINLDKGKENNE